MSAGSLKICRTLQRRTGRKAWWCTIPAFLLAAVAWAAESPIGEQHEIVWVSNNSSPAEIPIALAEFYIALYNTGQLPLTRVQDSQGRTIEQLLRDLRLFAGPHFPMEMDSLMCDLNPALCTRNLEPVSKALMSSADAHLRGYDFSPTQWVNGPGAFIVVPEIELQRYEEFTFSWKSSEQSVDDILRNRGVTCEEYRQSCLDAVRLFNRARPEVLSDGYEGRLILPTWGVSATVQLQHLEEQVAAHDKIYVRQAEVHLEQMQAIEHAEDAAYQALAKRVIATGEGGTESGLQDEPHFSMQRALFELIHHPGLDDNWSPALDWNLAAVVVFDDWVDMEHCDIGENVAIKFLPASLAPNPGDVVAVCGDQEIADPLMHHGTHVVALLAASLNQKGIGGLLAPEAKVFAYEIDRGRLGTANYRKELSQEIAASYLESEARTFNFSWSYVNSVDGADKIQSAIELLSGNALVVVAAGNQGMEFSSGNCTTLPACFHDYRHVITVVGLNRNRDNPGLWAQSNHGAQFHVGAIAEDVLSATRNGRFGTLSGTSQAAPQVSATAAYLWAEAFATFNPDEIDPERIKNRIIYTADFIPMLKNKVLGGRLNMKRALDIARVRVETRAGVELSGQILALNQEGSDRASDTVVFQQGSETLRVQFKNVKRLIRLADSGNYVVFFLSPDEGNRLVRRDGLVFLSGSQELELDTDSGPVMLTLAEIADYTARF